MLADLGVDLSRPIVAFVGRITRQKGVAHLVAARPPVRARRAVGAVRGRARHPRDRRRGWPRRVTGWQAARTGVIWVRRCCRPPRSAKFSRAAAVFVCPSVYEPLGIVNLEAMACATAVVASDVGGIPEVVADRPRPGVLVHYDTPGHRGRSRPRLADAVNSLVADPETGPRATVEAGRQRCIDEFSWAHIAEQTTARSTGKRPVATSAAGPRVPPVRRY